MSRNFIYDYDNRAFHFATEVAQFIQTSIQTAGTNRKAFCPLQCDYRPFSCALRINMRRMLHLNQLLKVIFNTGNQKPTLKTLICAYLRCSVLPSYF